MDFFEALQALPDEDFFESLEKYEHWIPTEVGDRWRDGSDSYANKEWEVLRIEEPDPDRHSNNITVIRAGDKPDKDGKYDIVGFTSALALMNRARMGKLRKVE